MFWPRLRIAVEPILAAGLRSFYKVGADSTSALVAPNHEKFFEICFVRINVEYNWLKPLVFEGRILGVVRVFAASCNKACQISAIYHTFRTISNIYRKKGVNVDLAKTMAYATGQTHRYIVSINHHITRSYYGGLLLLCLTLLHKYHRKNTIMKTPKDSNNHVNTRIWRWTGLLLTSFFFLGMVALTMHHHNALFQLKSCAICKAKTYLSGALNKVTTDPLLSIASVNHCTNSIYHTFSPINFHYQTPFIDSFLPNPFLNRAPPFII